MRRWRNNNRSVSHEIFIAGVSKATTAFGPGPEPGSAIVGSGRQSPGSRRVFGADPPGRSGGCRFIREKSDVLLLGPPGVGKSFLVQAIGHRAIKAGMLVLYRSIFDLARDFLSEEETPIEQDRMLARYLKPELLIIDDMGMKQLPRRSGEYLLEIIMRRHENRSTMMTSNRPLEDWAKLICDAPAATAILD